MATALRPPVPHDARLSLTEHLDELRSRLIVCVFVLIAAFAFTFWQNEAILKIVNDPLEDTQRLNSDKKSNDPLEQTARSQRQNAVKFRADAVAAARQRAVNERLARAADSAAERTAYTAAAVAWAAAQRASQEAAESVPTNLERKPVTLGVAEPFTTTFTVAFYAAILISLPILLFQLYAFILPAFAPGERKVALPLMLMVPFLFAAGVSFGYFVVLPRAVEFLQNFNDDDFDILVQARDYYKFSIMFIGSIGLLFQIPVAVIAITRLGIATPKQLHAQWRYVLLGLAVLAAVATPTPDPVTMLLALAPLFLLFEVSILASAWLNRVSPPGSLWGEHFDDEDSDAPDVPTDED
jgi:sec-independent protein translocase protein TatC